MPLLYTPRRPLFALAGLLFFSLLGSGCVTTSQGRRMERKILALEAQFDELRSEKERLKETLQKAQDEMRKLEEANGRATDLFQRNTADFGVQVDRMRIEIAQQKGMIETLQHKLGLLERAGTTPAPVAGTSGGGTPTAPPAPPPAPAAPPALPEGQAELYTYGYDRQARGDHAEARRAFKEYVVRFPKDKRADNALYFWGESFYQEGMHTEAVQVLQRILTSYPKGDKVDDTLFKIGEIFEKLGKCSNAKAFYEELLDKHPKSPLARATRNKIKGLKC